MAGKIFINCRRGESLKDAQLLATPLDKPFGAKQIFLEMHGIDGGTNWLHTIEWQRRHRGAGRGSRWPRMIARGCRPTIRSRRATRAARFGGGANRVTAAAILR
jgi:hypothetical protein